MGANNKKLTTAEFVARAVALHGDRYDYSRVVYQSRREKVMIICPEHGGFEQAPGKHIEGKRCPKCAGRLVDVAEFIKKARAAHGDKYDYSQVVFVKGRGKVKIICPAHGVFCQVPSGHLSGKGCAQCGTDSVAHKLSLGAAKVFAEKAQALHGLRYDYSQVCYVNNHTAIKIACPDHGIFEQVPGSHLAGNGCPMCWRVAQSARQLAAGAASFLEKARAAHGDRYDYSRAVYTGDKGLLEIICPEHGIFSQAAGSHKQGQGCPACGRVRTDAANRLSWIEQANGRPATLYFLRFFAEGEEFYKVGITYHTAEHRYRSYSRHRGYSYEILAQHTSTDAARIWDWEQSILETFAHLRYQPKNSFDGETECFSGAAEILSIFPL